MLSPKQKYFYKTSNAKINISHGAVRSGKTFITNLRWIKYIREAPPGKLLMSGRTKDSLKENVLQDIFDIIGEENYDYKESTGELRIFDRYIKCVGADDINAEKKIRGQTYAGWYGDEITIQHHTFIKQAITRCSVANAKIFWTTNPDLPTHHIKRDFIDNEDMISKGQVRVYHFTLDDNHTLTDDYKNLLKASFSGVFYARNILGMWVVAEGLVYGEDYNREKHLVKATYINTLVFKEYIGGADFGFIHPMVGLVVGVTTEDKYYVIDEFYKTKKKTEALRDFFLSYEKKLKTKLRVIFCDSAEQDRILTLQEGKLKATNSNKEINAGINTVGTAFKSDRLYVSEACIETDRELQMYRYPDEDDTKFKKGEPLDEHNHAMDALRYCIHNYEKYMFGKRLREEKKANKRDTARKTKEAKRLAKIKEEQRRKRYAF